MTLERQLGPRASQYIPCTQRRVKPPGNQVQCYTDQCFSGPIHLGRTGIRKRAIGGNAQAIVRTGLWDAPTYGRTGRLKNQTTFSTLPNGSSQERNYIRVNCKLCFTHGLVGEEPAEPKPS